MKSFFFDPSIIITFGIVVFMIIEVTKITRRRKIVPTIRVTIQNFCH
ncbi:MAG: hypothetical protein N2042_05325 [Thermodesulfovibrio sp.]|nr:hypothetical protein [Thermodesulfovibrio sp.]